MQQSSSVVAIFCEDIREEKSGQDTLIGVLPDNINMTQVPSMLPKLGLYLRAHIPAEQKPPQISGRLVNVEGVAFPFKPWEDHVVEKAFEDSRRNAMPLIGLIMKMVAAPFPITGPGKIVAYLMIDDQEFVAGVLNVTVDSNVSPQPASQSGPASQLPSG